MFSFLQRWARTRPRNKRSTSYALSSAESGDADGGRPRQLDGPNGQSSRAAGQNRPAEGAGELDKDFFSKL